jgi:hypothetical protein
MMPNEAKRVMMNWKMLLALLILASAAIFAWNGYRRADIQESSHATAALAREAGAVARGWLPEFLPPSATDIRERHDLDTNAVILRFSFSSDARDFWKEACQPLAGGKTGRPEARPDIRLVAGTSWWPGDVPPAEGADPDRAYFSGPKAGLFLAIEAKASTALAWTAGNQP